MIFHLHVTVMLYLTKLLILQLDMVKLLSSSNTRMIIMLSYENIDQQGKNTSDYVSIPVMKICHKCIEVKYDDHAFLSEIRVDYEHD